jgi:hypothetical protein
MSSSKVKLNSGGMKDLLTSNDVRDMLTERAERVLAAARSSAPVLTGTYQSSLHLEQDTTDRAVVRVVADAPHSHVVEANTGNLASALDSAG